MVEIFLNRIGIRCSTDTDTQPSRDTNFFLDQAVRDPAWLSHREKFTGNCWAGPDLSNGEFMLLVFKFLLLLLEERERERGNGLT